MVLALSQVLGSQDKTRPLFLGGHSPVGEIDMHTWSQHSVYMCCLSSLFLLSPPLQERKTPSLQVPTPEGPGQQLPQRQREQEELSEPQRPFKLFLRTWRPGRACGSRSVRFPLGHEINHPSSFQDKGCGIMNKLAKGKRKKWEISSSIFPFTNGKSIVSLQLKAQEQNRRLKPGEYRCSLPPHTHPPRKRKTYTSFLRNLTHLRSVLSSPFTFLSCLVTTDGYLL